MTFDVLVDNLIRNTLETSLPRFLPELILCATIVTLLVTRILRVTSWIRPSIITLIGTVVAFWFALPEGGFSKMAESGPQEIFQGMLVYDSVTVYLRIFLLLFTGLFVVLTLLTGLANKDDSQDLFTLVLGAVLGMCIMGSANHLMTIFLGIEMASLPSYVLAGMIKGRKRSSEASLKYAIYGAGAAGVMLYGISLLAGVLGSVHLPTMAQQLAAMDIPSQIANGEAWGVHMVLALAGLMVMVGLAFKLSAVPFHFWCPDVFEGASAEINAFLSVASKAAALVLLVRVTLGLGMLPGMNHLPEASVDTASGTQITSVDFVSSSHASSKPTAMQAAADPLSPVRSFMVKLIGIIAIVTCTFGNLAAYGQTNIKRMLAYSTIAHAGYMMMAVVAAIALVGQGAVAEQAISGLLLYISLYLFMNLGAFAIIAFLRNSMQSEEIRDYAGLIRSNPVTAVSLVIILVSLLGIPPVAGFWGKLAIFKSLYAGGGFLVFMLFVAGINTVISLIYYLRVAKTICVDEEPDTRGPVSLGTLPVCYAVAMAFPLVLFGLWPEWISAIANAASKQLFL